MSKRLVVYTAFTQGYDTLREPEFLSSNADYVCFSDDRELSSQAWQIRRMEPSALDDNRRAKVYKVFPERFLPEYDLSIWVDANFKIVGDVSEYVASYLREQDMLCMKHPKRSCLYDEAEQCIATQRDHPDVIQDQMAKYRAEGYPVQNGLAVGSVLVRRHGRPDMTRLMSAWWQEISQHSRRDQLSFNYVCWKHGMRYDVCDLEWERNEYFIRVNHSKGTGRTTTGRVGWRDGLGWLRSRIGNVTQRS